MLQPIWQWLRSRWFIATKNDLEEMLEVIMTEIDEFTDAVNADFATIQKGVDGIAEDVTWLKDKLVELPTGLTPKNKEDLAAFRARFSGLAAKVKALDEATEKPIAPPVEPPAPA